MPFLILGIIIAVIIIAAVYSKKSESRNGKPKKRRDPDTPEKRAGDRGEIAASNFIVRALDEDDRVFKNVEIVYDGREAELDEVVVNRFGVFIIEVKNILGTLEGDEDDYEWKQYKTSSGGVTYENTAVNPIRQVKREVFLLKSFLLERGVNVWIEGYVFFVQGNSPVSGGYVLEDLDEIDRTVHTPVKRAPGQRKADLVAEILEQYSG